MARSITVPQFPGHAAAVDVSGGDVTFSQARTVYAGGAGDVVASPAGGEADVTFTVPAGGVVPVQVVAVKETGTTATALVSIW
jgi:ribosomal protein S27E